MPGEIIMTPREEAAAKAWKHSAGSSPVSLLAGVEQLQPQLNRMKDQAMIDAITGGTIEQSKVAALSNAAWHMSMVRMYLKELAS